MWTVNFYNFGYVKTFKYPDQAFRYAKESGFECVVYDPDMKRVRSYTAY
jgi:hypothetical protein